MNDEEKHALVGITVAPYLQKATALIGKSRRVGGNQFRHAVATMAILIDYHYTDPILLKAAIVHDLFEDCPATNPQEIISLEDGQEVYDLVMEVTRRDEPKTEYLRRILNSGSLRAKILKVADRISNLTDLHNDIFDVDFMERYVNESETYVYPIALEVNENMAREIKDLIEARREFIEEVKRQKS